MTVLYVTHDQEEAMVMSDRICLMNLGRIEQIGAPGDLYFRPKSLFAADFLGESNLIKGRIIAEEAECLVLDLPGIGTIRTRRTSSDVHGPDVVHFTRPESIEILSDTDNRANRLCGQVTEVVVSGAITKLFIRIGETSTLQVSQLTCGARSVRKGEMLTIGWNDDVGRVFSDNEREAA
jgi:putative spermidine/putrescine transport system ATP-binding protein